MSVIVMLIWLLVSAYTVFITWCLAGWEKIPVVREGRLSRFPRVTVIVAARNEESTITRCLASLSRQHYPPDKFEIIVADDHSTDQTFSRVEKFSLENPGWNMIGLKLQDYGASSKKEAIRIAVHRSSGELILTTDADCIVPENWIASMAAPFVNEGKIFIAGPVLMVPGSSWLNKVQGLEFMGLIGIAAAGISQSKPLLSNGANLAYTKQAFEEAGGFTGRNVSASGDDTQLMRKIAGKHPQKMVFVKSAGAVVETKAEQTVAGLLQQHKRWASKIPATMSPFTVCVAVIAWLAHLSALIGCGLFLAGQVTGMFLLFLLVLKIFPEYLLLNSLCRFFGNRKLLWLFLPAQPFYWIFIVLVGAIAPIGKFQWKERYTR